MVKPRIFISHSAKDYFAQQVQDALYQRLEVEEFDPWLDNRALEPGDMWRRKIHGELRQCDAGVILLSKDALTSPWVLYETTVLTLHKDEWPEFDVIPVRLPDVTREDLAKGTFSPFALNEIQAAKGDTVEDIVDKIVERLALLKIILAEGPLQQFERTLSLWLKKDVDVLREAASKLGLDVEQWPLSERYSRVLLARELIKADGQRVLNALRVLTLHLNKDSLFGMITILTSLWVNEQAARLIPSVMKRPATQRAVSTNGRGRYTGRMYVLRALANFRGGPRRAPSQSLGKMTKGRSCARFVRRTEGTLTTKRSVITTLMSSSPRLRKEWSYISS